MSLMLLPLTLLVASPLIIVVSATAYVIHALHTTWGLGPHLSVAGRIVYATGSMVIRWGGAMRDGVGIVAEYLLGPSLESVGLGWVFQGSVQSGSTSKYGNVGAGKQQQQRQIAGSSSTRNATGKSGWFGWLGAGGSSTKGGGQVSSGGMDRDTNLHHDDISMLENGIQGNDGGPNGMMLDDDQSERFSDDESIVGGGGGARGYHHSHHQMQMQMQHHLETASNASSRRGSIRNGAGGSLKGDYDYVSSPRDYPSLNRKESREFKFPNVGPGGGGLLQQQQQQQHQMQSVLRRQGSVNNGRPDSFISSSGASSGGGGFGSNRWSEKRLSFSRSVSERSETDLDEPMHGSGGHHYPGYRQSYQSMHSDYEQSDMESTFPSDTESIRGGHVGGRAGFLPGGGGQFDGLDRVDSAYESDLLANAANNACNDTDSVISRTSSHRGSIRGYPYSNTASSRYQTSAYVSQQQQQQQLQHRIPKLMFRYLSPADTLLIELCNSLFCSAQPAPSPVPAADETVGGGKPAMGSPGRNPSGDSSVGGNSAVVRNNGGSESGMEMTGNGLSEGPGKNGSAGGSPMQKRGSVSASVNSEATVVVDAEMAPPPVPRVRVGRSRDSKVDYQVLAMLRRDTDPQDPLIDDVVAFVEFFHPASDPRHLRIEKLLVASTYENLGLGKRLVLELHRRPRVETIEVWSLWHAEPFYRALGYEDVYRSKESNESGNISGERDGQSGMESGGGVESSVDGAVVVIESSDKVDGAVAGPEVIGGGGGGGGSSGEGGVIVGGGHDSLKRERVVAEFGPLLIWIRAHHIGDGVGVGLGFGRDV
ncbi:hypothetical protein HDU76_006423 [Blyttiomyces sp. JEL0837]|nr:hypothetical protein HDU76_006423 [Blyttiomyces sp. JEL0837]